jgi:hypothetical protein
VAALPPKPLHLPAKPLSLPPKPSAPLPAPQPAPGAVAPSLARLKPPPRSAPPAETLFLPEAAVTQPPSAGAGLRADDGSAPPELPAGFERKGGGSLFSRPYFAHVSGAFSISQLLVQPSPASPRVFDFASGAFLAQAPPDDGTGRKVLVVGADGSLPEALERLVREAAAREQSEQQAAAARKTLPVKMDRPVPVFKDTLGREWSEKFRDGTYVKFEHRHSRIVCSQLWMEETEPGFAPTYFNFATLKRTSMRPIEDAKTLVVGTPLPPPPDLPPPRMPVGWVRKYASTTDDTPFFESYKTGASVSNLFLEEPGIGHEGRPCYWSFLTEERFTMPPHSSAPDEVAFVDAKGKDVDVAWHSGPTELTFGFDDDGNRVDNPLGKQSAKDVIASGTVNSARAKFAAAGAPLPVPGARPSVPSVSKALAPSKWQQQRAAAAAAAAEGGSSVSAESVDSAQSTANAVEAAQQSANAAAALQGSENGASLPAEAAVATVAAAEDGSGAFVFPAGWQICRAEDGDVFYMDSAGNALWLLFVQVKYGESLLYYDCSSDGSTPLFERPPVADGDPASAVVNVLGERVSASLPAVQEVQQAPQAQQAPVGTPVFTFPEGWTMGRDDSGDAYFVEAATGAACWASTNLDLLFRLPTHLSPLPTRPFLAPTALVCRNSISRHGGVF